MTTLVSAEEYRSITGDTCDDRRLRVLLKHASSAILAEAHGQEIVSSTSTDTVVFNYEGRFYLPQRPVTNVASVTVNGEELETNDYRWTAGGNRRHAMIIRRYNGLDGVFFQPEATVTYTHGWATVPGQIVMAVVAIVSNLIATQTGTRDLTMRQIGNTQERYAQKLDLQLPDMNVTGSTRAILDKLCEVDQHGSVSVQRGVERDPWFANVGPTFI